MLTRQTDRYTYGYGVVNPAKQLGTARRLLAATGNSDIGLFGGGNTSGVNNVDKYTFSSNTVNAGASLGLARFELATCGTSTTLGMARQYLAATGNSTIGIFGGGTGGTATNYTDTHTYTNNAVSPDTMLLGSPRQAMAATSSPPGGF